MLKLSLAAAYIADHLLGYLESENSTEVKNVRPAISVSHSGVKFNATSESEMPWTQL